MRCTIARDGPRQRQDHQYHKVFPYTKRNPNYAHSEFQRDGPRYSIIDLLRVSLVEDLAVRNTRMASGYLVSLSDNGLSDGVQFNARSQEVELAFHNSPAPPGE